MVFYRVLCMFNRHRPDRDRVRWTGLNYVADCKVCHQRIRRISKGRWSLLRQSESES
ncbi:hypothetical protein [Novosphingobium sp. FKTRR1]|uniref:hypothetical protein n=1 Tax=Novosphingobium sp. FKTRR1 TaxID=2879118 RepID=UPI001CEFF544|nr:hypothetical protein [Novosphingobium sp. FKTRR1]